MMEAVSRQSKNAILSCLRSHSPMNRVNILHLFPFLTLGLAFLDTQLLEVDVCNVEDAGCVSFVGTFLTAK
jgi:hypothetical protein